MIWLIIFLLLFALILLILSIPLDIILKFGSLNFSAAGSLTIKLLNITIRQFSFSYNIGGSGKLRCNFKLPIRKRKTESPFIEIDFEGLLKKTKVNWSAKLSVGTGDAAMLSLIIGFLRTFLITLASVSLAKIPLQTQYISISPVYGKNELRTGFSCILKAHLGHIIIETIKSLIKSAWKR